MAKYEKWLKKENLLLIQAWARDGLTDEQIAHNMKINPDTLYQWKKKYSEISEALKKGKEVVDIEVENALLKKTQGYNVELKKSFKVKRTEYDDHGRKTAEYEELVTGIDEVHIPADTVAQIFWLKNRRPDKWRDKTDDKITTEEKTARIDLIKAQTKKTSEETYGDLDEMGVVIDYDI